MAKINITNQTAPSTPAAGTTELYIDSTTKVLMGLDDTGTSTDYSETGGAAPSWTSWATVTISGGGTLTYTTANARYYFDGKILYAQFDFTQTAPGSGTADITIDPPGGVTLLDAATCGTVGGLDIGNDNVHSVHAVEAINSTNKFQIRRTGTSTYFRGGTHVGNNGNGYGFSVVAAIA